MSQSVRPSLSSSFRDPGEVQSTSVLSLEGSSRNSSAVATQPGENIAETHSPPPQINLISSSFPATQRPDTSLISDWTQYSDAAVWLTDQFGPFDFDGLSVPLFTNSSEPSLTLPTSWKGVTCRVSIPPDSRVIVNSLNLFIQALADDPTSRSVWLLEFDPLAFFNETLFRYFHPLHVFPPSSSSSRLTSDTQRSRTAQALWVSKNYVPKAQPLPVPNTSNTASEDTAHSLIVFDLFSGIGTTLEGLIRAGKRVRRYYAVELDPTKRSIAVHYAQLLSSEHPDLLPASALTTMFSLPQNVTSISPDLLPREVDLFVASPPCQGLSRANPHGRGLSDPRSGLFFDALNLLYKIRFTSPAVQYLFECSPLDDSVPHTSRRREDMRLVSALLRAPFDAAFDAALISHSHRRRHYWSNIDGARIPFPVPDRKWVDALDPDHEPGIARVTDDNVTYYGGNVKGQPAQKAPTVVRSQDSYNTRVNATGFRSAFVKIRGSNKYELPRVNELERMLGIAVGATAAPNISEVDRRMALGDVIDRHVLTHFFNGITLASMTGSHSNADNELDEEETETEREQTLNFLFSLPLSFYSQVEWQDVINPTDTPVNGIEPTLGGSSSSALLSGDSSTGDDVDAPLPSLASLLQGKSAFRDSRPLQKQQGLLTFRATVALVHPDAPDKTTPAHLMLDSGSTHDIVSKAYVDQYNLQCRPARRPMGVRLADGRKIQMSDTCALTYSVGDFTETRTFYVLPLSGFDIIWGMKFLTDYDPAISFRLRQLRFRHDGRSFNIACSAPARTTTKLDFQANIKTISAAALREEQRKLATVVLHVSDLPSQLRAHPHLAEMSAIALEGDFWAFIWEDVDVHIDTIAAVTDTVADATVNVLAPCQEVKAGPDSPLDLFISNLKPETTEKIEMSAESHQRLVQLLNEERVRNIGVEPTGLPPLEGRVVHNIVEEAHTQPPCFRPHQMSPAELRELKTQLDFLLERGYIRPSSSPYGAPVLFAPKKDGGLRLCLDFRGLNNQTVKDKYPLPRDQDIFDQLGGKKYFSSLDALWGYWQIRIADKDVHKAAIRTPLGSYEFLVMPFGLTNAPATFQRFMEDVLRPHLMKYCMVYIDDIIIYSDTAAEHAEHIEAVLRTLAEKDIKIKLSKCSFFRTQIDFLGHVITRKGILAQPSKIAAIVDWPTPKTVKHVQQFMGLANYYRRHVHNFAEAAAPLTSISDTTGFVWNENTQKAFETVKAYLTAADVLATPNMSLPFIVRTDASDKAIGGSLHQIQNGEMRVIAYESKKLSAVAQKWPTTDREMFAFFHCFRTWRHYLQGSEMITLEGDHKPLTFLKTQKELNPKQARWLSFMEAFNYHIVYVPGVGHIGPDALSRTPLIGDLQNLSNALLQEAPQDFAKEPVQVTALLNAIENVSHFRPDLQSESAHLGDLYTAATWLQKLKLAYVHDDIFMRLSKGHEVPQYFLRDGLVYHHDNKRQVDAKVYVPENDDLRIEIIAEFHDTPTSGHFGTFKTSRRVQRIFYWPNMDKTVAHFVASCDSCKRYKARTRKSAYANKPFDVPEHPWDVMGMDEKTGLPTSSKGNDAIWVFVDHLTGRAHIVPCKKPSSERLAQLYFDRVFRHHGLPRKIVSDRDSRFTAAFWQELMKTLGTELNLSTANHPETDGKSERFIKTVIQLVSLFAKDNPRNWDTLIPALEFAYNDSVSPVTGYTPFELDMGRTPNSPAQLIFHGLVNRPILFRQDDIALDPHEYVTQLSHAIQKAKSRLRIRYQTRSEALDKGHPPPAYKPGDQVYMEHPKLRTPQHTSMDPVRIGPFRILESVSNGSAQRLAFPPEMARRYPVVNNTKLTLQVDRQSPLLPSMPTSLQAQSTTPVPSGPNLPSPLHEAHSPSSHATTVPVAPLHTPSQSVSASARDPPQSASVATQDIHTRRFDFLDIRVVRRQEFGEVTDHIQFKATTGEWKDLWDWLYDVRLYPALQRERFEQARSLASHDNRSFAPLLTLVKKKYAVHNQSTTFFGLVVEHVLHPAADDPQPHKIYRIVHSDGDNEYIDANELAEITVRTVEKGGKILRGNTMKKTWAQIFALSDLDFRNWSFPVYLSKIYRRLTTSYYDWDTECDTLTNDVIASSHIWSAPKPISRRIEFILRTYHHANRDGRSENSSLTIIVPAMHEAPFWRFLKGFRILDAIPAGSTLIAAAEDGRPAVKAKWDILALYLGSKHLHTNLSKLKGYRTNFEIQRLRKVSSAAVLLAGDDTDQSRVRHVLRLVSLLKDP